MTCLPCLPRSPGSRMDVMTLRVVMPGGWKRALLAALLLGCLVAPARASGGKDGAGVEFFEKRIRPLLVKHCYECHGPDTKKVKGELQLDTREAMLKGGITGPALVPGKP